MPTVLTELPLKTDPPRKRWTRAEFEAIPTEVLGDQKLELVEGELISKMGKRRPHVIVRNRIRVWLDATFGPKFVNSEAPVDVSPKDNPTSEPEADLIVLKRAESAYATNPGPGDLHLVVEIGDTTLGFDLTVKARLYARAGIPEYWVVDVSGRRLIVHRNPRQERYESVNAYAVEESVAPLAAPQSQLRVGDLFTD